jgi:hypothetical protein
MEDKFTWKGQLTFVGSSAQFNELSDVLEKYPSKPINLNTLHRACF